MSYAVQVNESSASRRVVYLWCVQSNGTTPAANEAGGQPNMSVGGLPMWASAATLSAISATAGHYSLVLGASDISLLGQGTITYSSGTALPTSVNVEIVGYDPFVAFSRFTSGDSVGLKAQVHSGATVGVGGIAPATYSGVTVGINNITPADYSAVTVRVGGIAPATYSGVTVGVNNIAPGSYSGVTIAGVTRVNSSVTIADADYSAVTVRVAGAIALTSAVTLAGGRYSDVTIGGVEKVESAVTIGTGGIIAASFGAGAIDAVALATDAGQEIADRLLVRSIAGGADSGRTVGEAFAAIRNRVAIDGSAGTVYKADDSTSFWTFSVATVSADSGFINQVDPG